MWECFGEMGWPFWVLGLGSAILSPTMASNRSICMKGRDKWVPFFSGFLHRIGDE